MFLDTKKRVKKIVLVLAISMQVIVAKKRVVKAVKITETVETIENSKDGKYLETNFTRVLFIWYLIIFQRKSVFTLFDSSNKVNIIYLIFTKKLRLFIIPTDIGTWKIDDTMLDIYKIIVAVFLMTDKANWVRFCEKILLMANISPEVVCRMLFFILSSANIDFLDW